MPTCDNFTTLVKNDYKNRGLTIPDVADRVGISPRQFVRQLQGETKVGMMPLATVSDLKRAKIVSESTAKAYIRVIADELGIKVSMKLKRFR